MQVIPDGRCMANALRRVTSEKTLPLGTVNLRFPVASDGRPLHYFEAVGPHDPEAAVGVARACNVCRWRLRNGDKLPADAWGSVMFELKK